MSKKHRQCVHSTILLHKQTNAKRRNIFRKRKFYFPPSESYFFCLLIQVLFVLLGVFCGSDGWINLFFIFILIDIWVTPELLSCLFYSCSTRVLRSLFCVAECLRFFHQGLSNGIKVYLWYGIHDESFKILYFFFFIECGTVVWIVLDK